MNSYNENLSSNIAALLRNQELDQKVARAELDAITLECHHAQESSMTAKEQLKFLNKELERKKQIEQELETVKNISTNQLLTATQSNQFVNHTITCAAVCASNVQIAANAVVKLAGDLGSIFSIVNSADFGTDLFYHAEQARDLINVTAYEAEELSQLAMSASTFTSEISSKMILNQSKCTNSTIGNMLENLQSEHQVLNQWVSVAANELSSLNRKLNATEGIYADKKVNLDSISTVYHFTNQQLNLDLMVKPIDSGLKVSFNQLKNPFENSQSLVSDKLIISPVKQYFLIFSKHIKKNIFSESHAQNLTLNSPKQYFEVKLIEDKIDDKKTKDSSVTISNDVVDVRIKYNQLKDAEGSLYTLQDTDGDDIIPDTDYVVFILAIYHEDYKKKINNYEDFLSAPSPVFSLSNYLKN